MTTTMVKKRAESAESGKDEGGRKTAPIQVRKDLARMAAVIASHDGITQSDLVSPVLESFLLSEYDRVQKEMRRQLDQLD